MTCLRPFARNGGSTAAAGAAPVCPQTTERDGTPMGAA